MKKKAKKQAKKGPKKAARKVSPIPAGYHSVTPYLVCRGAAKAIAFYAKAFGAKELFRMASPDGNVAHAEVRIGDCHVMLGDESPAQGASAPQTIGGTAVHLLIYTPKVDQAFARAVAAGATVELAPVDMFWGDRYCKLVDPFGHKWALATHIEDVSPKETNRRAASALS